MTMLERLERWMNRFREETRRQPTRDDLERAERERERRRVEAWQEEVAQLIALRGSWLPGDGDEPRQPQVAPLEGYRDGGPFYGFVRW